MRRLWWPHQDSVTFAFGKLWRISLRTFSREVGEYEPQLSSVRVFRTSETENVKSGKQINLGKEWNVSKKSKRERDRQTDRHRDTYTETHIPTHTETERERERPVEHAMLRTHAFIGYKYKVSPSIIITTITIAGR